MGYFFLAETRIASIFKLFYDVGIIQLIYIDESINDRVANAIYPLHGAYLNNFLPGGFHSFTMMHGTLNNIYNGLVEKIMNKVSFLLHTCISNNPYET